MPVLVIGDVPGQTEEGYTAIRTALEGVMKQSPGFIMHTGHAIDGGWRIYELWESNKDASDFFAKYVHPNLPPNIKPKRTVHELQGILMP